MCREVLSFCGTGVGVGKGGESGWVGSGKGSWGYACMKGEERMVEGNRDDIL